MSHREHSLICSRNYLVVGMSFVIPNLVTATISYFLLACVFGGYPLGTCAGTQFHSPLRQCLRSFGKKNSALYSSNTLCWCEENGRKGCQFLVWGRKLNPLPLQNSVPSSFHAAQVPTAGILSAQFCSICRNKQIAHYYLNGGLASIPLQQSWLNLIFYLLPQGIECGSAQIKAVKSIPGMSRGVSSYLQLSSARGFAFSSYKNYSVSSLLPCFAPNYHLLDFCSNKHGFPIARGADSGLQFDCSTLPLYSIKSVPMVQVTSTAFSCPRADILPFFCRFLSRAKLSNTPEKIYDFSSLNTYPTLFDARARLCDTTTRKRREHALQALNGVYANGMSSHDAHISGSSILGSNTTLPIGNHDSGSIPHEIQVHYAKLVERIMVLDQAYYDQQKTLQSDKSYDTLVREMIELEKAFPKLICKNSASRRVGCPPHSSLKKVKHFSPMLSLESTYSEKEILSFLRRVTKALRFPPPATADASLPFAVIAEPKIDGVSCALRYALASGEFISAATRGDGNVGEDVTQNVQSIVDLPKHIDVSHFNRTLSGVDTMTLPLNGFVEIRGEIYMEKDTFHLLNARRTKKGLDLFSNPRNAASGILRQKRVKRGGSTRRSVNFFAYSLLVFPLPSTSSPPLLVAASPSFVDVYSQRTALKQLKAWGFDVPLTLLCATLKDMHEAFGYIEEQRASLAYEVDGVVFKINDLSLQQNIGELWRSPRWAIAQKFIPQEDFSKILDIIVQIGPTGALTPVALFSPIKLGGVEMHRATLHNADEIQKKDIRIGDTILIQRAGDVIPQIISVNLSKRPTTAKPFLFPTHCPICGSAVEQNPGESTRRCSGKERCSAQQIQKLKRFVSKQGFNIQGLSEQRLTQLYEKDIIRDPTDLFVLREMNKKCERGLSLVNYNGWGNTSAEQLFAAIDASRIISLDKFLFALSIPYVGLLTAELLSDYFSNFTNLLRFLMPIRLHSDASCNEYISTSLLNSSSRNYQSTSKHLHDDISHFSKPLLTIKGIGSMAANSFVRFFQNDKNFQLLTQLGGSLSTSQEDSEPTNERKDAASSFKTSGTNSRARFDTHVENVSTSNHENIRKNPRQNTLQSKHFQIAFNATPLIENTSKMRVYNREYGDLLLGMVSVEEYKGHHKKRHHDGEKSSPHEITSYLNQWTTKKYICDEFRHRIGSLMVHFTGKTEEKSRLEMEELTKSAGITVVKIFSKKVDLVIIGRLSSQRKVEKAKLIGCPSLNATDWIELVEKLQSLPE